MFSDAFKKYCVKCKYHKSENDSDWGIFHMCSFTPKDIVVWAEGDIERDYEKDCDETDCPLVLEYIMENQLDD